MGRVDQPIYSVLNKISGEAGWAAKAADTNSALKRTRPLGASGE